MVVVGGGEGISPLSPPDCVTVHAMRVEQLHSLTIPDTYYQFQLRGDLFFGVIP